MLNAQTLPSMQGFSFHASTEAGPEAMTLSRWGSVSWTNAGMGKLAVHKKAYASAFVHRKTFFLCASKR